MRSKKIRVTAVVVISLIMAALRTVIVTYNMEKNEIDTDTYYLPDNLEVTAFTVVSILFAFLFLGTAISLGKKKNVTLERSLGAVPAGSLVLGFSLIGVALFYSFTVLAAENAKYTLIELVVFVLTILSAAKFLVSGLRYNVKHKNNNIHAVAALVPIFLSIFRLLADFISTSAAPLASSGAYHIVGLIAVLIYFLCEGKSYISETSAAAFHGFGYISIYFLLIYSIPNLFLHCFGAFAFNYSAAFSVADLGLVVYLSARLTSAKSVAFSA